MTAKTAHTPGRIEVSPTSAHCILAKEPKAGKFTLCVMKNTHHTNCQANMERLAACWNACEGIENPEAVGEVMDALAGVCEYWDEGTSVHPNSLIVADLRAALAKAGVK